MWQAGLPVWPHLRSSCERPKMRSGTSAGEAGAPSLAFEQDQRVILLNLDLAQPLIGQGAMRPDPEVWLDRRRQIGAVYFVMFEAPPGRIPRTGLRVPPLGRPTWDETRST